MFEVLQILTVMVAATAFALSLAHALELPGKMRLDKDESGTIEIRAVVTLTVEVR